MLKHCRCRAYHYLELINVFVFGVTIATTMYVQSNLLLWSPLLSSHLY